MDCSLPGSSAHGILQARTLEWVAILFSRRSSQPRDQTQVSLIAGRFSTVWATREALERWSKLSDYLTLLEAGSLRAGCQYIQMLVGTVFPAERWVPSHCVFTWPFLVRVEKDITLFSSSYKFTDSTGLRLFHRVSVFLSYFFTNSISRYSHSVGCSSTYEFRRNTI